MARISQGSPQCGISIAPTTAWGQERRISAVRNISALPLIRREALGRRLDAEQTRTLLDGLVRAGWLKLVTTKTDGRAIHRWQVNPLLFSGAPEPERSERSERGSLS